jgi:outer membrane protein assembly factor BamB
MFGYDNQHRGQSAWLGAERGEKKWALEVCTGLYCGVDAPFSSPAVAPDGTVYYGDTDPKGNGLRLYAVSPSGQMKWFWESDKKPYEFSTPAVGSDGTVYISTDVGLFAIRGNGSLKWKVEIAAGTSSPNIAPDGTIYVGAEDGLYAINPSGG